MNMTLFNPLVVSSLVDLQELDRPSTALHNELQFGGPRGPKALFF